MMNNHRLINIAILPVEREYTVSLDVEEIIKYFAIWKVRKITPELFSLFHIFVKNKYHGQIFFYMVGYPINI